LPSSGAKIKRGGYDEPPSGIVMICARLNVRGARDGILRNANF
jgi:hypothetical protein